ncbi:unnamed protein product [Durusdinium trenchii]|uniref:Uncharacterized protein n=1 Tax=Durusdinium trenchii TaxID=1381693 RepID=A0ABP0QWA1_9DINO
MARPGTIDYSKWEKLAAELSDEDEPTPLPGHVPPPFHGKLRDEDAESDSEVAHLEKKMRLQTGICERCGNESTKRCSRCQKAWFCDEDCQAAAWRQHAITCFAHSETQTWWGKLTSGNASNVAARGLEAIHQERLAFRRAVAATFQRKKAAAAAAAAAASTRVRQGQEKGVNEKGGKGEEKEETCAVCQCEFTVSGDSGEGICCPSSHFLCSECTGVFIQSILNDLGASYPPKCSMCRAEIPIPSFERQLNPQQQKLLAEFVAQRALASDEAIMRCPCGYMEVRADNPVLWWCQLCKCGECQVCNQPLPSSCSVASEEELKDLDILLRPHVIGCCALREAKQKVDLAFDQGQKMPCPVCGLAGRKDEACTHMSCPRCQTSWCYLCGLSVEMCDKKPPLPGRPAKDIFLHNADWEVNPARCPMYLTQILEVDPSWLGDWTEGDEVDDEQCLAYFHRWRTIKLLQEVQEEVGLSIFQQVWLHFASIRSAGYSLEEIMGTDTSILIDREGFAESYDSLPDGTESDDVPQDPDYDDSWPNDLEPNSSGSNNL